MPFFREHAVSFDREAKQIGFGEKCGPPPGPPRKSMTERLCEDGKLVDDDGNIITDCAAFVARALLASSQPSSQARPGELRSPGLEGSKL